MSDPYAIRIHETGGPEVLKKEPLDLKQPGPGQALVRQSAVGLNFIDTYFRTGLYPAKFPFTPGGEGAGLVEAVGEGVTSLKVGDRVGYVASGTYATHVTLPADRLLALPEGVSDEDAAAVMLKGLTAWMLLFEIRPIRKGDTLLVWAPVGGVGSLLASDVIVGYDNVAAQVKALTDGEGVEVALDSVGKISAEASLASLKKRGWFVSYGNASGPVDPIPPARLSAGGSLVMTRPGLFHFIDTSAGWALSSSTRSASWRGRMITSCGAATRISARRCWKNAWRATGMCSSISRMMPL